MNTTEQKREKDRQRFAYQLRLERLMDSLDFSPTGVMVVQTMMIVREFVIDLNEDQIKQLVSADPVDLVRLAGNKGLESDLTPVPKFAAVNRVNHNGQYRDYSKLEELIASLEPTPEFE